PEQCAPADSLELAMVERGIGGDHHDDAAGFTLEKILPQLEPHRRARDGQDASVIALDESAERPASQLLRQPAARRPDPTLPAEGHGPAARAHAAFLDRTALRRPQCLQDVALRDRALPDVIEDAIVGLRN